MVPKSKKRLSQRPYYLLLGPCSRHFTVKMNLNPLEFSSVQTFIVTHMHASSAPRYAAFITDSRNPSISPDNLDGFNYIAYDNSIYAFGFLDEVI